MIFAIPVIRFSVCRNYIIHTYTVYVDMHLHRHSKYTTKPNERVSRYKNPHVHLGPFIIPCILNQKNLYPHELSSYYAVQGRNTPIATRQRIYILAISACNASYMHPILYSVLFHSSFSRFFPVLQPGIFFIIKGSKLLRDRSLVHPPLSSFVSYQRIYLFVLLFYADISSQKVRLAVEKRQKITSDSSGTQRIQEGILSAWNINKTLITYKQNLYW